MTWTPSYGLLRAHGVVCSLAADADANGHPLNAVFQHHMTSVIAKEIDDARMDGTFSGIEAAGDGMPAWAKHPDGTVDVGATFAAATTGTGTYSAHFTNGNGHASTNPDDYSDLLRSVPRYEAPLDDHMPDYNPAEVAEAQASILTTLAEPIPEAPKKRRGRPPGSKAKAAKPAKKRKSAKAIRAELYPVDAPVAETVAPVAETVAEAPAEAVA